MSIGPNGPVSLDAGTYDYDDLRERLRIALAGPEEGRLARVRGALRAARFSASQIPVLRVLSLSLQSLKQGEAATISIIDVLNGVALSGTPPIGMVLNSNARTITGTPEQPGSFSMTLTQTLAGAIGSPFQQTFDLTVEATGNPPVVQDPVVVDETRIAHDGTPQVDELLTGVDPVFRYAQIVRRRWLLNGSQVATGTTFTPRSAGSLSYIVDGVGDNGKPISSTATVTVAAASARVAISGTPPTAGTVGQSYSFTPNTTNGSGTKVFSKNVTLLAGLTFSTSTGAITGTPTAAGAMTDLSVTVTDDTGSASTMPTTVTIVSSAIPSNQITADGEIVTADGEPITAGVY